MHVSVITCNRLAVIPMIMVCSSSVSAPSTDMNPSSSELEEHEENEDDLDSDWDELDDHNLSTSSTNSLLRAILEK